MLLRQKSGTAVVAQLLILALFATLPAAATVCTVTSDQDSGPGSLRAAIGDLYCDSIDFDLPVPAEITLTTGELQISRSLTITGPGEANLMIRADGSSRIFAVSGTSTVAAISGLGVWFGSADRGGGILVEDGTLTLSYSVVSWNHATLAGGGVYVDSGTLNLVNSTVSQNGSHGGGGGINVTDGTLNVTGSTIALNGTQIAAGGIGVARGTLNLTNSTVLGNQVAAAGSMSPGTGGGIFSLEGTAHLTNVTIAYNTAMVVSGVRAVSYETGNVVTMKNTLLALNGYDGKIRNCGGTAYLSSSGYNLSDDDTCAPFFGSLDKVVDNGEAKLGAWGDNGGPTWTVALDSDSPAVNAIPPSACTVLTDQRGAPRFLGGANCDIGAFEYFDQTYIPVIIDIKPGTTPNDINLGSGGTTTVAICSASNFDPATVDPAIIRLAGVPVAMKGQAMTPMASYEDLNVGACAADRSYPDLVVHFNTQDLRLRLQPDAAAAILAGWTATEPRCPIIGGDSVRIVPPGK